MSVSLRPDELMWEKQQYYDYVYFELYSSSWKYLSSIRFGDVGDAL